jgi:hypothetical protein
MNQAQVNLYFKDPDTGAADGRPVAMFHVDANFALSRFPEQWSKVPWADVEAAAQKATEAAALADLARKAAEDKAAVDAAQAAKEAADKTGGAQSAAPADLPDKKAAKS